MDGKDLKKLNRQELLELLIQLEKENEQLREENGQLRSEAASRKLTMLECGTMSEAALKLSRVFEAADEACAVYLENMQACDELCSRKLQAAEEEAADIVERAKKASDKYWLSVSEKIKAERKK